MADPKQEKEKAAAPKAEASEAKKAADAPKVDSVGVRVKSKVNMLAKDGTRMVVGENCTLAQAEYERLKDDARHAAKPFFEKI